MATWDNTFDASPTKIKTYLQCPAQYFYRYEKRYKGVYVPNHAMVRGNALHLLMRRVLRLVRAGRAVPDDIHPLARAVTAGMDYPEAYEKMRTEDAQLIAGWSGWALGRLGDEVRVLGVEQELVQDLPRTVRGRRVALTARLDAVVEHPDGSIEHIDYKTGGMRPDPVQELVSRTVVGPAYDAKRRIRTTTMFVAHKQTTSRELHRDEMRQVWEDVKRAITAMAVGDGPWEPRPSALCQWCPYCDICPASSE